MWIFTTHGFFSIVCLNNRPLDGSPLRGKLTVDKGQVAVRARVRKHLESLVSAFGTLGNPEILDTPGRDYACRIIVPLGVWGAVAQQLALGIDYDNFKGRVGHRDEAYARWLGRVWGTGYSAQREAAAIPVDLKARKEAIDALAKMPTREFITLVRRTVRSGGWSAVDPMLWRALVTRQWAALTGKGANAKFDLTEEGQRRLGTLL